MNKLIKLILGIGCIFLLFSYSPSSKKRVIKYYFLLDRNSQTLIYEGDTCRFTPVKNGRFYISIGADHLVGFQIGSESYDSVKVRHKIPKLKTLKKPLRFLDHIKYYNEDWLRKYYNLEIGFRFIYDPDVELELFVIDEASIKNDSLYVYETGIVDIHYD